VAATDDLAICSVCGAASRLRGHYQPVPLGFGRRGLICPGCRLELRRSRPTRGKAVLAILLVVLCGALLGGSRLALEWGLSVLVLPVLLIVAHELTHAVAGRLAGARVFEVRIGWHRPRFQVRLGRLRLTLARGLARGGFCVAAFLRPRVARWRYAVLYGAPMLLHLAGCVAVIPFLSVPWPLGELNSGHFFFFFNALLFVASARPIDYPVGAFRIPNDGKALLALLRDPDQAEAWRRQGFVLPALYALTDGEPEEALARARDVEHLFPDDPEVGRALFTVYWALGYHAYALRFAGPYADAIRQPAGLDERQLLTLGALQGDRLERWLYCVVCLHGEAWDAALNAVDTALKGETLDEARAMWLALRSYVLLLRMESPEERAAGRAAAREAFELLPWVAFVCGTFGAALIDGAHPAEGLERLEEADALDVQEQEVAARKAWRAIGCAQVGRMRYARALLREAGTRGLEVGPPPALLRRAEASIALRSRRHRRPENPPREP
jgi:hypothetical protein